MPLPRFRIRTLMIAIAVLTPILWLKALGFGDVVVLPLLVVAALALRDFAAFAAVRGKTSSKS